MESAGGGETGAHVGQSTGNGGRRRRVGVKFLGPWGSPPPQGPLRAPAPRMSLGLSHPAGPSRVHRPQPHVVRREQEGPACLGSAALGLLPARRAGLRAAVGHAERSHLCIVRGTDELQRRPVAPASPSLPVEHLWASLGPCRLPLLLWVRTRASEPAAFGNLWLVTTSDNSPGPYTPLMGN